MYFEILNKSIELNNVNVCEYYTFNVSESLANIYGSKTLTSYQQEDVFQEYMTKAYSCSIKALNTEIFKVDFYNRNHFLEWLKNGKKTIGYLRYHSFLLSNMEKHGKLSRYELNEFLFTIGSINKTEIDNKLKNQIIAIIANSGLDIYNQEKCSKETKESIQYAFKQQIEIFSNKLLKEIKKEVNKILK